MKAKLSANHLDIDQEYIKIVNLARIVFVFIFYLLYEYGVKINTHQIQKFLKSDSEVDNDETKSVSKYLLDYNFLRTKVNTKEKISKNLKIYFILSRFKEYSKYKVFWFEG